MPRLDKPSSLLVPFLVLPENRFAFEAVSTVGEEPYRPIYLYGPSGTGKSHLARHAVRQFLSRRPQARVEHVTAAEFAAEFADASSRRAIPLFHAATREFDMFVIEDLHVLSRRRETQQQLLMLCDELASMGCQLVWTSRSSAGDMPNFMRKLVTRFRAGVTAQIRLPGRGSRARLLKHFAQSRQLALSGDAADLLGEGLAVSPRELWRPLGQIESISRQHRRPINSDKKLNEAHFGPDSHFTTLLVKSGKKELRMQSWHEGSEANGGVATSHGTSGLGGQRRLEVLRKEPADYLYYRFVWSETRGRLIDLIPNDGKPVSGKIVTDGRGVSWRESPEE
ncbi:MAG TPA: DnaA/Hda family protein [Planctomycetaceae bacterium]